MSRYSKQSFFYQQRKRYCSTKRVKKHLDTQSVLGERRESILLFRPGLGIEEELGNIRLQAKSPGQRQRRPSSAASRKSSVWFPPIDITGPHLTTTKPLEEALLDEDEQVEERHQPKYKFNEIKIASTSILSNLSRRLAVVINFSEVELPESLVNLLILTFNQLVADTVVEKREWQTDQYLDHHRHSKVKAFLTGIPDPDDPIRLKIEASLNKFAKRQELSRKRKRNMSDEKQERPQTAKSTMSVVSMKSDISEADSRVDYDKLPPELRTQGPEILRHRRESKAPKLKIPGARTRLEKFNNMRMKANQERNLKAKQRAVGPVVLLKLPDKKASENEDTESVHPVKGVQMINFSLSSKECADNGWIVHPSRTADPEGYTLYQWATTRLQETMRQREEYHLTAKLRGEDGPLVVKYYSDPHYRPFKGARQRTTSFPLPAVLSRLPPSLATFTSHTHNDVFFSPSDGQTLCLLTLPDGSGFCNYYSGRRAVSLSRKGDGSRGLYVVVFDDTANDDVIASFMPDGRACCYHKNGNLHLLADSTGGILMDEEGFITRQWDWPKHGEKMGSSISIQLNTHVLFQCSGKYQMNIKFSCHGQMHRFPVGLKPEYSDSNHKNEAFWMKSSTVISNEIQTNLPFESVTAKKSCQSTAAERDKLQLHKLSTSSKPPPHGSLGGKELGDSLNASQMGSLSKINVEPARGELEQYKTKIKSIVDDWMNYYRQTIGIAPPSRPSQQSSVSPNTRLTSSQGLRGFTSSTSRLQYPQYHSPLSWLPASPYTSRPLTPVAMATMGTGEDHHQMRAASSLASPLERFIIAGRPQSQNSGKKPFKVGPAKPKQRPDTRFRRGCPLALHETIVRKLSEKPNCRCRIVS